MAKPWERVYREEETSEAAPWERDYEAPEPAAPRLEVVPEETPPVVSPPAADPPPVNVAPDEAPVARKPEPQIGLMPNRVPEVYPEQPDLVDGVAPTARGRRNDPFVASQIMIDGIIEIESGGNPNAVNPRSGAKGLMQVMDSTAKDPGYGIPKLEDPFDAKDNVRFGTEYLNAMLLKYEGSKRNAVIAYNWGPGNTDKWLDDGGDVSKLPDETQNYLRKLSKTVDLGDGQAVAALPPDPTVSKFDEFVNDAEEARSSFGRSVIQGTTAVVAGVPKSLAIGITSGESRVRSALDRVDAGEELSLSDADIPFIYFSTLKSYQRGDDESRARIRERLGPARRDAREHPLYEAGQALQDYVRRELPPNPRYKGDFWLQQFPEGLGSTAGFLATGVVGRVLGMPAAATVAASGASTGATNQFEDALRNGASFEDAETAAGLGALIGTSEAAPIAAVLGRLDRGTGGAVRRLFTRQGMKKLGIATLIGGGEELIQEVFQAVADNLVASEIVGYDEDRKVFEGAEEGAKVGFTVGALFSFVATAIGGRRSANDFGGGGRVQKNPIDSLSLGSAEDIAASPLSDILNEGTSPLGGAVAASGGDASFLGDDIEPPADVAPPVDDTSLFGDEEVATPLDDAIIGAAEDSGRDGGTSLSQFLEGAATEVGRPLTGAETEEITDAYTYGAGSEGASDAEQAANIILGEAPQDQTSEATEVTPVPVAAPAPAATESDGDTVLLDPSTIKTDAERFQFKSATDSEGVSDQLQGVKRFDPRASGVAIVWENNAGEQFIVDGHQRLALAKRMQAEGQEAPIRAFVLRESEGVSAEYAREVGAIKNLQEGGESTSALDIAKVIRSGTNSVVLDEVVPPQRKSYRDGRELAKLGDDAFGMVINEVVPPQYAVEVGRLLSDPAQQVAALEYLAKSPPDNATQARLIVEQVRDAGFSVETQDSLFGTEAFTSALLAERAKVLDSTLKLIRNMKGVFQTALTGEDVLTVAGNVLDAEANREGLSQNERLALIIGKSANRKGPIADALNEAAASLKAGGSLVAVRTKFLAAVKADGSLGPSVTSGEVAVGDKKEVDASPPPPLAAPVTEKTEQGENFTLGEGIAPVQKETLKDRLARLRGEKAAEATRLRGQQTKMRGPSDQQRIEGEGLFGTDEAVGQGNLETEPAAAYNAPAAKPRLSSGSKPVTEIRADIADAVREAAGRIMPAAKLDLVLDGLFAEGPAAIASGGTGKKVPAAAVTRQTAGGQNIVTIAMAWGNPETSVRHEAVHVLRNLNLWTKAEWKILTARAESEWVDRYSLPSREQAERAGIEYDAVLEEAVAYGIDDFRRTGKLYDNATKPLLQKVKDFFQRLFNALRGRGFQNLKDVLRAFESGEVGQREAFRPVPSYSSEQALARDSDTVGATEKFAVGESEPPDANKPIKTPPAKLQSGIMRWLAAGQPLDRAIRLPFTPWIDEHGHFTPTTKMYEAIKKTLIETKIDPDGRFGFMSHILETARAGLIDRYGLSDAYIQRSRERETDERRIGAQSVEIVERLTAQGVTTLAESKVLYDILTGEEINEGQWGSLPDDIRLAIDEYSQELLNLGLISAESYERNRGKYLHRSYLRHESETMRGPAGPLIKWVDDFRTKRRQGMLGDAFKGRGMERVVPLKTLRSSPWWGGVTRGAAVGRMIKVLALREGDQADLPPTEVWEGPRPNRITKLAYWPVDQGPVPVRFSGWQDQGDWEIRSVRGLDAILWRDFTKDEREKMGEIVDARYAIAKTFMHFARDLSTGRLYSDIAKNGDWAVTKPGPNDVVVEGRELKHQLASGADWVRVPETAITKTGGVKKWGALSGMYVRPEIWRDLSEMDQMSNPGLWGEILTSWKKNKTARSPVVHMNNVMANIALMDLADVRFQDLARGLVSYVTEDEHYKDAVAHGAFGGDIVSQELRKKVLKPLLDKITRQNLVGQPGMAQKLSLVDNVLRAINGAVRLAGAFDRASLDLYRMEDEVFRMATYTRRLAMGDDAATAARVARSQFIDYDIRAPWVNAARGTVLPFASYIYRAAPLIAQNVAHRPWKIAKYTLLGWIAAEMAYMLAPGDEDEERRVMREEEKGSTWIGIPGVYMVPRMLRMPWRDRNGLPVFLDIRRWIPGGDMFDMNQGQMPFLPAPLQWGGPIMLGFELFLNKQAFTGDEIFNTLTDTKGEQLSDIGAWAWRSWMPSAAWIPGSWYWNKIERAVLGVRDSSDRPYSFPQAVLSSVGVKLKPLDVDFERRMRSWEYKQKDRELTDALKRINRDESRNAMSPGVAEQERARIEKKREKLSRSRDETLQ